MPFDRFKSATRALMMGVSVSTTVLTGCQVEGAGPGVSTAARSPERALYDDAASTRDPRLVGRFLRSYPNSRFVVPLLTSLPASTLARVPRAAAAGLPSEQVQRLPAGVRSALGIGPQRGRQQANPRERRTSINY